MKINWGSAARCFAYQVGFVLVGIGLVEVALHLGAWAFFVFGILVMIAVSINWGRED